MHSTRRNYFMNSVPWQDILNMTTVLALAIPMLAIVGMPIMIIVGQILSIMRERSAYAKCAKQIATLALIIGWALVVVGLGVLWLRVGPTLLAGIDQTGQAINLSLLFSATPSLVHIQADIIVWLGIFAATIMLNIVHVMWPVWEEKRVLHQCIALVSSFWYGMALYAIVCIISVEYAVTIGIDYPLSLGSLFQPSITSNFWNAGPYLPPLAFTLSASISSVWLIIRRKYDDYGRDYYANMLKWCAAWSRTAWFLLWFLLVGNTALQWLSALQEANYLTSPEFLQSALFLFLWMIPGALWTLAIRSSATLRHKTTLILACILAICFIVPLYISIHSL